MQTDILSFCYKQHHYVMATLKLGYERAHDYCSDYMIT